MKVENIKYTAQALFSDGSDKIRFFVTEEAVSNWANKQWRIDNEVTVKVYLFPSDTLFCTYHQ